MSKLLKANRTFKVCTLAVILAFSSLPFSGLSAALAQSDEPLPPPSDCAGCHREEYREWQQSNHEGALSDPVFIEAWARAGNPGYCQACHTTNYDPVENTNDYEGVGCLACHELRLDEPGIAHATVDTSAVLCGECHTGTHAPDYDEWLVSPHATANIACSDCHQSHNDDLHMADTNTLCTSCHEAGAEETVHGQDNMQCSDCHMHQGTETIDALSQRKDSLGHTFFVASDVCAGCHGMTHTLSSDPTKQQENIILRQSLDECRASEQAGDINKLNLGLAGGGLGGLAVGVIIPLMLRSRREK